MEKQEEVRALLRNYLDADLERMIFSGPRSRDGFLRMTVRPVAIRGTLFFQVEEFTEKQAFQKNLAAPEAAAEVPAPVVSAEGVAWLLCKRRAPADRETRHGHAEGKEKNSRPGGRGAWRRVLRRAGLAFRPFPQPGEALPVSGGDAGAVSCGAGRDDERGEGRARPV